MYSRTCLNLSSVLVMIISLHLLGVDLTLWAHEHSYERLWPLYNMQVRYFQSTRSVSSQFTLKFTHSFLLLQVCNGSLEEPYTNPCAPVHIITGSAVRYQQYCILYSHVRTVKCKAQEGVVVGGRWTPTWKGLGCLWENLS